MLVSVMRLSGNFPNISRVLTCWIAHSKYWIVFVISYSFSCGVTLEFTITGGTIFFWIVSISTSYLTCCRKFGKACIWFCIANNFFYFLNSVLILIYWFILYHVLRWCFVSPFSCFVSSHSY